MLWVLGVVEVVLEVLESVRCVLAAVEIVLETPEVCVRYVLGAVKDVRRMLKVQEVVLYGLVVVNGLRCVSWVLGVMLCMLLCILEAVEGESVC